MTKDDYITIVKEKSDLDEHAANWFGWEKAIKFKRAVPFHSMISDKGWTACEGKVKGKELIKLYLTIDTGITLSYKGKEWRETANLEIYLPFDKAEEIAKGIIRSLKRNRVKKID